ncbi:uncharacterized protein LOC128941812 [Melozone crissalis]|uniref:uncharacterized protein LOC128941812 n=1 Tax=Melozone crissalis TaxID=40204 RepID=UPI0023DC86CE|nr:uncharacterized protein LOC128941812 [Melozone crissalis]XP_054139749.1 uncharacterized protein LOC128941812 [Melozone crissalis]
MAAGGRAPLPGLSPMRGQSAGTAASARVTLALPGPASPGARPAAQNAASEPGAGPMALARQRRREAAGGALRAGKIIQLLPSLPEALVFRQPKARGLSTRALSWRALLLPTLWGCPCWSTLVPAIPKPWDTEGALSQVALAPWQGCGSSPRAAGGENLPAETDCNGGQSCVWSRECWELHLPVLPQPEHSLGKGTGGVLVPQ